MKKVTVVLSLLLSFPTLAQKVDMSMFHGIEPRNIGPAGMSGRVTAIDVNLSDVDEIYIGTAAGGVWRSVNSGHTWEPIFEDEKAASIGAISIYQANPDIIYVGTGEGNPRNSQNSGYGMYKTIDGGRTWQHLGLENTRQIHRVIVDQSNPDKVVIGVSGATWGDSPDRGIYKSNDGGKTWQKVLYIDQSTGVSDLVVDPSNPNHFIAGMWEHRRWPWFFKSGGPSSSIYSSYDGGETWNRQTTDNGLPKGDLGRIGLTFAPSNPEFVYAYIESESNAVFRSNDGGNNWKQVSKKDDSNIGGRPFYYADIYADVRNENRVYSIATEVTTTDDGGKTWSVFAPGNKIHTDHHAWWAHPEDQDFLMIGHDGGLNITHDRGENWWFPDNLPLAQFYHVRVDNEIPYNVYGGLQDNGSWRGPSQTWFKGGIRNMYWQRLSVGDGFDVVPDPLDNDYGYAMGQAGGLLRYHRQSGQLRRMKPVHSEGEYLRYNWNAGIGIDPHDQKTIYYGSQYLHKSSDYGQSWEIISPDLTTNDPEKQKFLETGGLTYDVTGAEFHTTIIAIAPSPLTEGVIWVGTDDGNVQLTRDGGTTWTNLTANIKGVPNATWVPHISPSKHNEGEAFVVFDDHRRNNWTPYVYRTKNYGKSWERLVDSQDVRGYALSFEQDPVEEGLLFCGTEFGLYVSFDNGANWNEWTEGLPTMPIQDMVIHPREHDLVLGTFGRAFWIMDDIRPLRAVAAMSYSAMSEKDIQAFDTPDAYLAVIGESIGYRLGKVGDALFEGENRAYGSLISYYLKSVADEQSDNPLEDSVKIVISNQAGTVVRTLYQTPKTGVNRVNWKLQRDAVRSPQTPKPDKPVAPGGGMIVPTGDYQVVVSYKGYESTTSVKVLGDPRLEINPVEMSKKETAIQEVLQAVSELTGLMDQLRSTDKGFDAIKDKIKDREGEAYTEARQKLDDLKGKNKSMQELIVGAKKQGIYRSPNTANSMVYSTYSLMGDVLQPYTDNQALMVKQLKAKANDVSSLVRQYYESEVNPFKEQVDGLNISWVD